jgi:hypothetical protein
MLGQEAVARPHASRHHVFELQVQPPARHLLVGEAQQPEHVGVAARLDLAHQAQPELVQMVEARHARQAVGREGIARLERATDQCAVQDGPHR